MWAPRSRIGHSLVMFYSKSLGDQHEQCLARGPGRVSAFRFFFILRRQVPGFGDDVGGRQCQWDFSRAGFPW